MFSQLATVLLLFLAAGVCRADGGIVRLSQKVGPWTVTVFTSPTPPRAGPVDVSVMVQDANGVARTDVKVKVIATRGERRVSKLATQAEATNKLFLAAVLELPEPGAWEIAVEIGDETLRFEMALAEPRPEWWKLAPWIGWPALAVGLYLVHRRRARRGASVLK